MNPLLPLCFAVHGWVGTKNGPLGKAGVHIVTVKVPDSCLHEVGHINLGTRCCGSSKCSLNPGQEVVFLLFFLKGNPWNVLGRIAIFQHVGSWYLLEDDQPNLFDLGD